MKRALAISLAFFLLTVFFLPVLSFAQHEDPADPYANTDSDSPDYDGGFTLIPCGAHEDNCTYQALFRGANNVINFVIIYLVVPLSTIAIALAGLKLVWYGRTDPNAHRAAIESFQNILWGMFWILGSFVVIKTIVLMLVNDSSVGTALKNFFQ